MLVLVIQRLEMPPLVDLVAVVEVTKALVILVVRPHLLVKVMLAEMELLIQIEQLAEVAELEELAATAMEIILAVMEVVDLHLQYQVHL